MPDFDPYYKWLGIPAAQQPPHHYRLLGVESFERDGDAIDAGATQRTMYLQRHAGGEHTAAALKLLDEVTTARRCLLDLLQKTAYDTALRAKLAPAASASASVPAANSAVLPAPFTPELADSTPVIVAADPAPTSAAAPAAPQGSELELGNFVTPRPMKKDKPGPEPSSAGKSSSSRGKSGGGKGKPASPLRAFWDGLAPGMRKQLTVAAGSLVVLLFSTIIWLTFSGNSKAKPKKNNHKAPIKKSRSELNWHQPLPKLAATEPMPEASQAS